MKTIYTVQHTQSVHHLNGMVGSWTDWQLTDFGKDQAWRIAHNLMHELSGQAPVVYSSDLKRAMQTAIPICQQYAIAPIARAELRERNLGMACNQSVQWLREHMEQPEVTVDDRMFSDAESRRDAWNRLRPLFDELMASDAKCLVVVSHGDLLGIFHAMFLDMSVEQLNTVDLRGQSGGVSVLQVTDEGKHVLRKLSDMSYLV